MGACILDLMIDHVRVQALHRMNKGYKPSLEVVFVLQELAFDIYNGKPDVQHDELLKLVIAYTPLVSEAERKAAEEKAKQAKDRGEEDKEKGKGKKKKKAKGKDGKGKERDRTEGLAEEVGHQVMPMHHSDHRHQHILQSNLFAGMQFLYKAGCSISVENGSIVWDTKTSTIRSVSEIVGQEKLLL